MKDIKFGMIALAVGSMIGCTEATPSRDTGTTAGGASPASASSNGNASADPRTPLPPEYRRYQCNDPGTHVC